LTRPAEAAAAPFQQRTHALGLRVDVSNVAEALDLLDEVDHDGVTRGRAETSPPKTSPAQTSPPKTSPPETSPPETSPAERP